MDDGFKMSSRQTFIFSEKSVTRTMWNNSTGIF
jgi:hypothetical protein